MNKTIYLRDEDIQTWERVKELAGDGVSQVIVAGLKRFIAEKEAEAAMTKGYVRIEVEYSDARANGIPRKIAFYGKWVFPQKEPLVRHDDEDTTYYSALALTAKGNVVTLTWHEDPDGTSYERFTKFSSLEEAAEDKAANPVAIAAIKALGVPVEELDI